MNEIKEPLSDEDRKVLRKHYRLLANKLYKGITGPNYFGALRLLVSHRDNIDDIQKENDPSLQRLGKYLKKVLKSLKSPK